MIVVVIFFLSFYIDFPYITEEWKRFFMIKKYRINIAKQGLRLRRKLSEEDSTYKVGEKFL